MSRRRSVVAEALGGGWRMARGVVPWRRATPVRLARMARAVQGHGLAFGGLVRLAAIRRGRDVLVEDDRGPVTAEQLDHWSSTVAAELLRRDVFWPGGRVGLLCRPSRAFVIAATAASRAGTDAVFLPTDAPSAVLAELIRTEKLSVIVHDDEFDDVLAAARFRGTSIVADRSTPGTLSLPSLATLPRADLPNPSRPAELIVLTGSSTDHPRATVRPAPTLRSALPVMTLFHHLEIRPGSPILIGSPMFQGFGFGFVSIALGLGCRTVLPRRFDAARTLALIDEHQVETLVVVPSMLARLARALADRPPPTSLRAIVSGAGALHPGVHARAVQAFGPIVYNLYGSPDAGWCTLADPADLAAAPGTIGRPAAGIRLAVLGPDDRPRPVGEVGRLCVAGPFPIEGAGPRRPREGALLDTGDLGHRDAAGYYFVDGRADGVITTEAGPVVLGAIERALTGHPDVVEAHVGIERGAGPERRVSADVVVDGDATPDDLAAHVATTVGSAARLLDVRLVDVLPTTDTGKLRPASGGVRPAGRAARRG